MTFRSIVLFVVAVSVVGCSAVLVSPRRGGQQPRGNGYTTGNPPPPNGGGGATASGDPQQQLQQLGRLMQQQGYSPVGPALRNNQMPSTNLIAYAVDVQPGRCYTVVALGDSGTNLDLILLDPQGRTEGANVSADTTPFVSFCPRIQGRYVARLQMNGGSGGYYYVTFAGPQGASPDLAAFFGTNAGSSSGQPTRVQTATIDATTQARLAQLDASMRRDNFTRVADPYGVVMQQRQDRQFPLNLSTGNCYAFATMGGPGTSDTDVFVVDGSGAELARDAGGAQDATVRFCPPATGSYQLRARLYSGNGPVFVAAWAQQQQNNDSGSTNDNHGTVISQNSTAGAGLDENFGLVNADMTARGYVANGDPSRGSLTEGQSRDFQISLEGGKCYAVLAVGDSGVRNLDLIIQDSSGRVVDRDVGQDARPIVRVCPTQSGQQTIKVNMTTGSGQFVYATYAWPRGTHGPFGLSGLMYVRLAEVTSLLSVENYEPSADFAPERGRLAAEGRTDTRRLQLAANHCYAIVVVGGDGVTNLSLDLQRGGRPVAADTTGTSFPNVRVCTDQAGNYDLSVTATGGSGGYFYQVFEREGH